MKKRQKAKRYIVNWKDIKKNTDECIRVIEETIFALKMESNITE